MIEVFGIPFQIYDEQQLYESCQEKLEEHILYSVFFVTAGQCGFLMDTPEEFRKKERVLWVPVGAAVSALFSKKEKHTIADFRIWKFLKLLATHSADVGAELCILVNTKPQADIVMQEFRKEFPYLILHAITYDAFASEEAVVNEINSIAPDILFLGLHTDAMKHFLERNRHRTNAGLCVFAGELLISEMTKKKKMFHTITKSRRLKKTLRKYNKKEQIRRVSKI